MAKKGDYFLHTDTPSQAVSSHPRRYGVMFNPASSRSRLRIIDAGRRYEVRLDDDGVVRYSLDGGSSWRSIEPGSDPCTGEAAPAFLSYDERRAGQMLDPVRFDMIAVGRGRVIAKEAGTDRLFHLVMDELFRTSRVVGPDCDLDLSVGRSEDPPLPGFYMKLDPEFFEPGDADVSVPPEATRSYAEHPASLRLPAFSELLKLNAADVMLVMQRPRSWYLVDARSPLTIVGPEDLRFTEDDFKQVLDEARIRAILQTTLDQNEAGLTERLRQWGLDQLRLVLPGLGRTQLRKDLGTVLPEPVLDLLGILVDTVESWIIDTLAPVLAEIIADRLPGLAIDRVARSLSDTLKSEGFGALVLPANAALLYGIYKLREGEPGAKPLDTENGKPRLHPRKALDALTAAFPENRSLGDAVSELMLRSRRRTVQGPDAGWPDGMPTPNQPPYWMPTYLHARYGRRGGGDEQERFAIRFSKILDLGVGYSHWSEHWQEHFGGEIHSLLATRPVAQQERYNLIQYRFLNGPVIDGDAFNDGTCNFYMLVKLGADDADGSGLPQRYAILWIDEQTYFTQRWRLLHPTEDVLGDLFSLAHAIKENPAWFPYSDETFWKQKFWSPFADDLIDDYSRMAVRRQIVALTGYDAKDDRHEIYTICFNYGVSDYTWRWRPYPPGEQVLLSPDVAQDPAPQFPGQILNGPKDAYVLVNTLDLRDDTTLHVRGTKRMFRPDKNDKKGPIDLGLRAGRWVQRYLPADCGHVPRPYQLKGGKPDVGFDHMWDFVSEPAYRRADRFYQFGVYEEPNDSRCQYYEVELLPGEDGKTPRIEDVVGSIWRNDSDDDGGDCGNLSVSPDRLHINTVNFGWSLERDETDPEYISLASNSLLRNHRCLPTMSMYEDTTRFRLLERAPLGLIAVFYDKRDDELQAASDLPREAVFWEDFEDETIPDDWENEQGGEALAPPTRPARRIRLLVKANRRAIRPPVVRKARVAREKVRGKPALRITFWTPQSDREVQENIWRVSLAAVDGSGVVPIFSGTRFPGFVRQAQPEAPLPLGYASALGDAWKYECLYTNIDRELAARIDRYCTPEGHIEYATSLWFEDVIGHRSTAQETEFV